MVAVVVGVGVEQGSSSENLLEIPWVRVAVVVVVVVAVVVIVKVVVTKSMTKLMFRIELFSPPPLERDSH